MNFNTRVAWGSKFLLCWDTPGLTGMNFNTHVTWRSKFLLCWDTPGLTGTNFNTRITWGGSSFCSVYTLSVLRVLILIPAQLGRWSKIGGVGKAKGFLIENGIKGIARMPLNAINFGQKNANGQWLMAKSKNADPKICA